MKKLLVTATVAVATLYLHGRLVFSGDAVQRLVVAQDQDMYSGRVEQACDRFAKDATFEIDERGVGGTGKLSGGREEMCQMLQQQAAAMKLLSLSVNTEYSNLTVRRSGFPWLTADIALDSRVTIDGMPGVGRMVTKAHEEATLVRGFSGVKFRRVQAQSRTLLE